MPPQMKGLAVEQTPLLPTTTYTNVNVNVIDIANANANDSNEHHHPLSPSAHTAATWALSICTLTHAWMLISVFPYSAFMAIDLIDDLDEESAGRYAGLLASFFMVGRAVSSYSWGKAADCYGRKFVLISSLAMSAVASLLFGLSPTFRHALLWRFLLGLANGIVGTAKTIVSEMAYGNDKLEKRGMGIVMGMWGWGFLFCPALSGALAEPVRQYPNSSLIRPFHDILSQFPFLLPNIMSIVFCATSIIAICIFVPETLPKEQIKNPQLIPSQMYIWLIGRFGYKHVSDPVGEYHPIAISNAYSATDRGEKEKACNNDYSDNDCNKKVWLCHNESLATSQSGCQVGAEVSSQGQPTASISSIWAQRDTRNYLTIYWVYSFVTETVCEAFPLFCISKKAGLGLSETSIGKILSGSGLIFACCQYYTYRLIVDRYGLKKSITICAWLSGPLICLVPISVVLNRGAVAENTVTWPAYIFICVLLATYRIFAVTLYSSMTIVTNRTVVPSHRATMNGLNMLGESFAKSLGPTFAGLLVASSLSSGVINPHVGAVLIWVVIGLLGCVTAFSTTIVFGGESKLNAIST